MQIIYTSIHVHMCLTLLLHEIPPKVSKSKTPKVSKPKKAHTKPSKNQAKSKKLSPPKMTMNQTGNKIM